MSRHYSEVLAELKEIGDKMSALAARHAQLMRRANWLHAVYTRAPKNETWQQQAARVARMARHLSRLHRLIERNNDKYDEL